jgi:hypothetical protein
MVVNVKCVNRNDKYKNVVHLFPLRAEDPALLRYDLRLDDVTQTF